jgi:hypothetical protein
MTKRIRTVAEVALLLGSYGLALVGCGEKSSPPPALVSSAAAADTQLKKAQGSPPEVVVYASELQNGALSEFDSWNDPASPGGRMVGTPNKGDELDPPPENDPHVTFKVLVQRDIPYRCWIHMKVGAPKGKSQANVLWVQLSDAVDKERQEVFKPGTGSYLTARAPAREGWTWVACDFVEPKSSLIYFRTSGEVTVRLQAGMEGVGFDQFLLSPARFLGGPPSEPIVRK